MRSVVLEGPLGHMGFRCPLQLSFSPPAKPWRGWHKSQDQSRSWRREVHHKTILR